jgi:LemA protein
MAMWWWLPVLALAVWAIFVFNRLVRLRNQTRTAWADIDVQLQRRHDLVPQLVAAVRGYAGHEAATLQAVTELRAQALTLRQPGQLEGVESALERALARLLALQEAYPDLKADANFAQLQRDLVETEEHLQYARRFYNGAVRDYSNAIQRVPDVLVAKTTGFGAVEFFQAEADSRAAVKVEMQP